MRRLVPGNVKFVLSQPLQKDTIPQKTAMGFVDPMTNKNSISSEPNAELSIFLPASKCNRVTQCYRIRIIRVIIAI